MHAQVVALDPEGAAAKTKEIKKGDVLLKVDDVPTTARCVYICDTYMHA